MKNATAKPSLVGGEDVRKALEFYADELSYIPTQMKEPRTAVHGDYGRMARDALAKPTPSGTAGEDVDDARGGEMFYPDASKAHKKWIKNAADNPIILANPSFETFLAGWQSRGLSKSYPITATISAGTYSKRRTLTKATAKPGVTK